MEENTMMLKQPRNDAGKLFVFANGHVEEIAADRERIFGRPSGDWIPDIAVKDSRVSRRHGQFMENYMDYMYTDTGSTNGTYLNGKLLEAESQSPYYLEITPYLQRQMVKQALVQYMRSH